MDIEELRAKAIASMSNRRQKTKQKQALLQSHSRKSASGNSLAPIGTTCSDSRMEKDTFLSGFQTQHLAARTAVIKENDDNLVIRFSDKDSDSDAEEPCQRKNGNESDMHLKGNDLLDKMSSSFAASSHCVAAKSHRLPALGNQMSIMQRQPSRGPNVSANIVNHHGALTALLGKGSLQQPSSNQMNAISQNNIANSSSCLVMSSGSDLENLRKQIATKENALKLQKNLQTVKGRDLKSVAHSDLHLMGNLASENVASMGKLPYNPACSKITTGTSDKDIGKGGVTTLKDHVTQNSQSSGMKRAFEHSTPTGEKSLKSAEHLAEADSMVLQSLNDPEEHFDRAVKSRQRTQLMKDSMSSGKFVCDSQHKIDSSFRGFAGNIKCMLEDVDEEADQASLEEGEIHPSHSKETSIGNFQLKRQFQTVGKDLMKGTMAKGWECDQLQSISESKQSGDPKAITYQDTHHTPNQQSSLHVSQAGFLNVAEQTSENAMNLQSTNQFSCNMPQDFVAGSDYIHDSSLAADKQKISRPILSSTRLFDAIKELEKAQEHRRKCEFEEQLAWDTFQKARQTLQAANQRCTELYLKKEHVLSEVIGISGMDLEHSLNMLQGNEQAASTPHSTSDHNDLTNMAVGTSLIDKEQKCLNACLIVGSDSSDHANASARFMDKRDQNDIAANVRYIESEGFSREKLDPATEYNYSLENANAIKDNIKLENSVDNTKNLFGVDGMKDFSCLNSCPQSFKIRHTESPCAVTNTESPLGLSSDHTEADLHSTGKRKYPFNYPVQNFELNSDIIGEESGGPCQSNNSHASIVEFDKSHPKRCKLSPDTSRQGDNYEEIVSEKSHSWNSIDQECGVEKEIQKMDTVVDKQPVKLGEVPSVTADSVISAPPQKMECQNNTQQDNSFLVEHEMEITHNDQSNLENDCNGYILCVSSEVTNTSNPSKNSFSDTHATEADLHGNVLPALTNNSVDQALKVHHYESPLNLFKSYRVYSDFITINDMPNHRPSASYVINPFWPLCKFEHRGKCNNEDCPWQHARDYDVNSSDVLKRLKTKNMVQGDNSKVFSPWMTRNACIDASKHNFGKATNDFPVLCQNIGSCAVKVPVYRIGSHLIKADNLMIGSLICGSASRYWKLGFCQSFSIPFAVQRILTPDMLSLCNDADRDWICGSASLLPMCLYESGDNGKPHDAKKDLLRRPKDADCWLELAISFMNVDSNVDKPEGRKRALYILSRALEVNPDSVALWAVYLHIFYRKEKTLGKDDMFELAVQHNKGSYELWLLFINSRSKLDQRLAAYNCALTSMINNACSIDRHVTSPYVLDLVLQLLNVLSVSENQQKAFAWIDELLNSNSEGQTRREVSVTISEVFSKLQKADACVLWVCCAYFRAYGKLPKSVLNKLEYRQCLPFDVEWPAIQISELSRNHVLQLWDLAVSTFPVLDSQKLTDMQHNMKDDRSVMHALAVNHVRCLLAVEGKETATEVCCKYKKLFPTCTELVSFELDSLCKDEASSIRIFEDSLLHWPENTRGMQRLWNIFLSHALQTRNFNLAKDISKRWFMFMEEYKQLDSSNFQQDSGKIIYKEIQTENEDATIDSSRRRIGDDIIFTLFNNAVYTLLNKGAEQGKAGADKALKASVYAIDIKVCIREYARLAFFCFSTEQEERGNLFDERLLHVLDECFQKSQLFPSSKPLSRAFSEKIKKPKVRLFVNNLLGPIPLDCSLFNIILETWYGPSLLPKNITALKEIVDFVEGCLELVPANLDLALSLFKMMANDYKMSGIAFMSILHWTSSVVLNCLFQSFPVATEDAWLEVGSFLKKLNDHSILEQFYEQALLVHPFSVALWRRFHSICQQGRRTVVEDAANLRGVKIQ